MSSPDLTLIPWIPWSKIEPFFLELERSVRTKDLRRWLEDWGELEGAIGEEYARRYVAMTCDTENQGDPYLDFVNHVLLLCEARLQNVKKLYLRHPKRSALPNHRYGVFDRIIGNEVEIYRDENLPLDAKCAELGQKYQKLVGGMVVEYDGGENTIPHMIRYLQVNDRKVRQEAWELTAQRFLRERDAIDALFDELVALRTRIARNAGFESYLIYSFKKRARFDYAPEDCAKFHDAVEKCVVPALRASGERRRRLLDLDVLRPWDLAVDPHGHQALRPFTIAEELIDACGRVFKKVHPAFARQFAVLTDKRYLDLESRKGKAPGGYQITFDLERLPFIFGNVTGLHKDVQMLLHEGGHAFHAMGRRHHGALFFNRAVPSEFSEVASMGMELLAQPYLEEIYSSADARRARAYYLEELLDRFAWIARLDFFEQWVYAHPKCSPAERRDVWADLRRRFSAGEDWSGYEEALGYDWQRVLHLFAFSLFGMPYGIAQTGALQLWNRAKKNRKKTVADYRRALSLGWMKPLPELFKAAGIEFDFAAATLGPLVDAMTKDMERFYSSVDVWRGRT